MPPMGKMSPYLENKLIYSIKQMKSQNICLKATSFIHLHLFMKIKQFQLPISCELG